MLSNARGPQCGAKMAPKRPKSERRLHSAPPQTLFGADRPPVQTDWQLRPARHTQSTTNRLPAQESSQHSGCSLTATRPLFAPRSSPPSASASARRPVSSTSAANPQLVCVVGQARKSPSTLEGAGSTRVARPRSSSGAQSGLIMAPEVGRVARRPSGMRRRQRRPCFFPAGHLSASPIWPRGLSPAMSSEQRAARMTGASAAINRARFLQAGAPTGAQALAFRRLKGGE